MVKPILPPLIALIAAAGLTACGTSPATPAAAITPPSVVAGEVGVVEATLTPQELEVLRGLRRGAPNLVIPAIAQAKACAGSGAILAALSGEKFRLKSSFHTGVNAPVWQGEQNAAYAAFCIKGGDVQVFELGQ